MITKHDLEEQREAIQDYLIALLDGFDERLVDDVCQAVVEGFDALLKKCEECQHTTTKKYEVYDNGKLAGYPYRNVNSSWIQPPLMTFEQAQEYAKQWLGQHASLVPMYPDEKVDYSGNGDFIEIRTIK